MKELKIEVNDLLKTIEDLNNEISEIRHTQEIIIMQSNLISKMEKDIEEKDIIIDKLQKLLTDLEDNE